MFTKEDYDKYFEQIARVERKMIYGSYELGRETSDFAISKLLKRIGDDEVRHYSYVLKMLKSVAESMRQEYRREVREYFLGTIRLSSEQDPASERANAYCVNLSKSGICLEGAFEFPPETRWELEIQLFGKPESITRRGKIVWSKEVEPGLYISGVQFDPGSPETPGS